MLTARRVYLVQSSRAGFAALVAVLATAVVAADDKGRSAVDLYGDEIPAGAAVRLGTARFRGSGCVPLFTAGDEALITMSSYRRQLAVLDVATGKRLRTIEPGERNVTGVWLSPDRRSVFTFGHEDQIAPAQNVQTVKKWDLATGKLLQSWQFRELSGGRRKNERFGGSDIAVTPDGRTVVTACEDGTLHFWDLTTGDEVLNYRIDQRGIDVLALSPDGKLVAASGSFNVYLWDWSAGKEAEIIPVGERVSALAFSPDGSILAEGLYLRTKCVLRDVKSRKVLHTLEDAANNPMFVTSPTFSPDGRSIFAANPFGVPGREIKFRVQEWDVATGRICRQYATEGMRPSHVAVSADGNWLAASTNYDSTLKVWDLRTGKLTGGDMPVHDGNINSIHLSRDGSTAVTAGQDGTVCIWDATTGMQRHLLRRTNWHANWVRGCAFSGDGRLIASSSLEDTVRLWDASTGNEIYRLPGHGDFGGPRAVAFSADQRTFASWGGDFYLRVWDVKTAKARQEWRISLPDMKIPEAENDDDLSRALDHQMQANEAVFSGDARVLVLIRDQTISIFDVATGRLQSKLTNPAGYIDSLALANDGKLIATSSRGRTIETIRVLEAASGTERFHVELPNEGAGPVAFSADSRMLAFASERSTAPMRVVDAASGEELAAFPRMPSGAHALCFSSDGKRLACGFHDGTALIWDLKVPAKKISEKEKLRNNPVAEEEQ